MTDDRFDEIEDMVRGLVDYSLYDEDQRKAMNDWLDRVRVAHAAMVLLLPGDQFEQIFSGSEAQSADA
jgi:hypothetical protein